MRVKVFLQCAIFSLCFISAFGFENYNGTFTKGNPFIEPKPIPLGDPFEFVAPLTSFFEGFEGTSFPGWVMYDMDGNGYSWTYFNWPALAHSGNGWAGAYYDTLHTPPWRNDDWLVTPPITITSGTVLSFWIASQETHFEWLESYQVWVSTTTNARTSFTDSIDGMINVPHAWQMRTIPLDRYVGQTIYIAWRCTSNDDFILKLDDINVGSPLSYAMSIEPSYAAGVVASGATIMYNLLIINAGALADAYGVTLLTPGIWPAEIVDSAGTTPVMLTDVIASGDTAKLKLKLTVPNRTTPQVDSVQVEIQSIGDPSVIRTVWFTPTCQPPKAIPYRSGFDTEEQLDWWLIDNIGLGLYNWFLVDTSDLDTAFIGSIPYSAVAWQDSSQQDIWLITPLIDLTGVTSATLSFDQMNIYGSRLVYHGIWASTKNASPKVFGLSDWVEVTSLPAASEGEYTRRMVSLNSFARQRVFIAFRYRGFYADIWFIDDVAITSGAAIEDRPHLADRIEIIGNEPNPFNATTTIRTNRRITGNIEIFDIGGRFINSIGIDGTSAIWCGEDTYGASVPSGVYLYRLQGSETIHRMVLLK